MATSNLQISKSHLANDFNLNNSGDNQQKPVEEKNYIFFIEVSNFYNIFFAGFIFS